MKQANPLLENAMCNALAGRFLCCRPMRSKFRSDRVLRERFAACVADRHIEAFDVDAPSRFQVAAPRVEKRRVPRRRPTVERRFDFVERRRPVVGRRVGRRRSVVASPCRFECYRRRHRSDDSRVRVTNAVGENLLRLESRRRLDGDFRRNKNAVERNRKRAEFDA